MDSEIIDNLKEEKSNDATLKNALKWWEKKRIWFNGLVAIAGIIPILLYANTFYLGDLIGIVIYGLIVNVFYSLGFLLEAFSEYYLKQSIYIDTLRYPMLILGTLLSSLITYYFAVIYFTW